jgi:hypothetical protein
MGVGRRRSELAGYLPPLPYLPRAGAHFPQFFLSAGFLDWFLATDLASMACKLISFDGGCFERWPFFLCPRWSDGGHRRAVYRLQYRY